MCIRWLPFYVCTTVYTYTLFCCVYVDERRRRCSHTSIICAMAFHDGRQYRRLSYLRLQSSPHHSNTLFYFISFFVPPPTKSKSLSFVSSAAGWSSSSSLVFVQQQQHKSAGNEERANGWTLSFRFLFEYVMVEREKERGGDCCWGLLLYLRVVCVGGCHEEIEEKEKGHRGSNCRSGRSIDWHIV